MLEQKTTEILIIGYGNTLRSDDAIGQKVAEEVEMWQIPTVRSIYLHQLTPELTLEMAQVKKVIFIDAIKMTDKITEIELKKVTAIKENNSFTHQINPQSLLYLTQQLYQQNPEVFWLIIPVVNFDFGEEFSPIAKHNFDLALIKLKELI